MKPYEQIQKRFFLNLWHLLPFTYVNVSRFNASEITENLLPLLIMQCSVTSGLLIWGFRIFEQKNVQKIWFWMQAFITIAILWMYITELFVLSKWLSITLHIGIPIIWFIALYKMLIVGYEVPPMRSRTIENPQSH